jgi:hypothetical protein
MEVFAGVILSSAEDLRFAWSGWLLRREVFLRVSRTVKLRSTGRPMADWPYIFTYTFPG